MTTLLAQSAMGTCLVLAEHDSGGMVQGGDQMRRRTGGGPGPAHGFAIDRDHPAAGDVANPTPDEDRQRGVQSGRVHAGEQLPHSGLHRGPLQAEPVQVLGAQIEGPFTDRGERPCTRYHRADRDSQHPGQRVTDPTRSRGSGTCFKAVIRSPARSILPAPTVGEDGIGGCGPGRGRLSCNSHPRPTGHNRHTRHAGHIPTSSQVTGPSPDLSGALV